MTTEPTTDPAKRGECWCCGTQLPAEELVRLGCHDEVGLCAGCIGWLAERRGGRPVRRAVPILATGDVTRALAHYAALGFETEGWEGGGYGFLMRDGVELHLGEREGFDPTTNTVSCYLHVRDADALYAEWAAAGVSGELVAPFDTHYGLREGSHVDPDGNVVRFGSPITGSRRDDERTVLVAADDPVAVAATTAIQTGDLDGLRRLLDEHPQLVSARIGSEGQSRTLLHVATDWPGHFPNVAQTLATLAQAGGDVNARFVGSHAETPLHWAASSGDVDAIDALLDAGADIEASGAVLGGGPPLADAVGFAQWQAARHLVDAGATTRLKDAAALGLMGRVESQLAAEESPDVEAMTGALWTACRAGQDEAAAYLLARGADANWIGWDGLTPLDVASQEGHEQLAEWLRTKGAKAAGELRS
jgi:uncharacterized protein